MPVLTALQQLIANNAPGFISADDMRDFIVSVYPSGKHTAWIPAASMRPTVSNGCAALTDNETTAGRPDMTQLAFDNTSDEHAQFQIAFPKMWNLGVVTFQAFWTGLAAGAGGVAWALQAVAASNDDTIDIAYGTPRIITDTFIAAEDLHVTAESKAVKIAGTPADDDVCYFRIFRDVSDAADTRAADCNLLGIKLFYTTDLATDD